MEFCRVLLVFTGLFLKLAADPVMAQDNPWQIGGPKEFRETYSGSGSHRQSPELRGQFAPENYSARGYWRESGNQRSSINEQYGNEQERRYQAPRPDNSRGADNARYPAQDLNRQQRTPGPQFPGGYGHKGEFAQGSEDESTVRSTGELIPNSAKSHATDPALQRRNRGRVYGEFPPLNHSAELPAEQNSGRDNRRYSDSRQSERATLPPTPYPSTYGGYYPGMASPPMPGIAGPSTFGNPYGGVGGMYLSPYGSGFPGGW